MKWTFRYLKSRRGFSFWTYKKDVGYVYEGIWFDKQSSIVYYKNYVWILNNCFSKERNLIGYKIRKNIR